MKRVWSKVAVTALVVAIGFAFSTSSYAGINDRQHKQQARIHQGVVSGELTPKEAKALQRQQNSIKRKERIYRSDGKLTKWERIDLHKSLDAASYRIYQQKHD